MNNQIRYYRKYPRTYEKPTTSQDGEYTFDISALAAVGIIVLAFAKGMVLGYLLKRKIG